MIAWWQNVLILYNFANGFCLPIGRLGAAGRHQWLHLWHKQPRSQKQTPTCSSTHTHETEEAALYHVDRAGGGRGGASDSITREFYTFQKQTGSRRCASISLQAGLNTAWTTASSPWTRSDCQVRNVNRTVRV